MNVKYDEKVKNSNPNKSIKILDKMIIQSKACPKIKLSYEAYEYKKDKGKIAPTKFIASISDHEIKEEYKDISVSFQRLMHTLNSMDIWDSFITLRKFIRLNDTINVYYSSIPRIPIKKEIKKITKNL
jgi:hypothetical protein